MRDFSRVSTFVENDSCARQPTLYCSCYSHITAQLGLIRSTKTERTYPVLDIAKKINLYRNTSVKTFQKTHNSSYYAFRRYYEKSRQSRAYPQQIVTTRLLYCLQDPFAQLSRLQRI